MIHHCVNLRPSILRAHVLRLRSCLKRKLEEKSVPGLESPALL